MLLRFWIAAEESSSSWLVITKILIAEAMESFMQKKKKVNYAQYLSPKLKGN